jgi:hypothetical protein
MRIVEALADSFISYLNIISLYTISPITIAVLILALGVTP